MGLPHIHCATLIIQKRSSSSVLLIFEESNLSSDTTCEGSAKARQACLPISL